MERVRKAASQEIELYEKEIYPVQDRILSLIKGREDFYLNGEKALARFYFQHRLSEGLDFFLRVNKLDSIDTLRSVKRADVYARDLAGLLAHQFDVVNPWDDEAYERLLTINTLGISGFVLMQEEIPAEELTAFIDTLKSTAELEVKKIESQVEREIEEIIIMNLWDFPAELRSINPFSIPVLRRRLKRMALPQRKALERRLALADAK